MFDPSAPHIIILLVVVLVLFGSTRLPGAARALGTSMHIFKRSVKGLDENGQPADEAKVTQVTAVTQAPQPLPAAAGGGTATQQDVADLQRQLAELRDLQRQSAAGDGTAGNGTARADAPHDQQPS
jgi:sec-independent protein translocase protein TatA